MYTNVIRSDLNTNNQLGLGPRFSKLLPIVSVITKWRSTGQKLSVYLDSFNFLTSKFDRQQKVWH
jgi:hypothetical protein